MISWSESYTCVILLNLPTENPPELIDYLEIKSCRMILHIWVEHVRQISPPTPENLITD